MGIEVEFGESWSGAVGKSTVTKPAVKFDDVIAPFLEKELGIKASDTLGRTGSAQDQAIQVAAYTQAAVIYAAGSEHTGANLNNLAAGNGGLLRAIQRKLESEKGMSEEQSFYNGYPIAEKFQKAVRAAFRDVPAIAA